MNETTPQKPKLSIITVNLNNAEGLRRTIDSVVRQTFTQFEYIIIDGSSIDESISIIEEFKEKITSYVSEPDKGIYHAMNKGILKAKGEYIQFLNSGDWLVCNDTLLKVFSDHENVDIIYGDLILIKNENVLSRSLPSEKLTMANFNTDSHATIQHPASFIKRSLFENDLYNDNYLIIADIHFFIKKIILQNCSVKYLPFAITNFDMTGISSQRESWQKTIMEREKIFSEFLPERILKDYQIFYLMKDSLLLKYMPTLNNTTGFHILVAKVVGIMVWLYRTFRKKSNNL